MRHVLGTRKSIFHRMLVAFNWFQDQRFERSRPRFGRLVQTLGALRCAGGDDRQRSRLRPCPAGRGLGLVTVRRAQTAHSEPAHPTQGPGLPTLPGPGHVPVQLALWQAVVQGQVGTGTSWNAGLTCVANGSRPSPLLQLGWKVGQVFSDAPTKPKARLPWGQKTEAGSPQSHASDGPRQSLNRCRKPACTGAANDESEPISMRLKKCRSFSDALP